MAIESVAVDLDGTVTPFALYNPKIKFPWYFFLFYLPIISIAQPNKAVIRYLRNVIEQGGKVLIVTGRPIQTAKLTKILLIFYRVPFTELFCVGNGRETNERKLDVIRKNGAKLIIDNDTEAVKFFRKNAINAVSIAELLTPSK